MKMLKTLQAAECMTHETVVRQMDLSHLKIKQCNV